jgi:hypothetical protein
VPWSPARSIGTTIEWYDLLLYSTVTGLVFAKLYFPQSDPLIGTMQAYAIFLSVLSPGRSERSFSATTGVGSGTKRR